MTCDFKLEQIILTHHDIKLFGLADQLHASVVDDHRLELDLRVAFGDLQAGSEEQTVSQLHNVGLVNGCDLLSTMFRGKVKGKLGDSFALFAGRNLQTFDDSCIRNSGKVRAYLPGTSSCSRLEYSPSVCSRTM